MPVGTIIAWMLRRSSNTSWLDLRLAPQEVKPTWLLQIWPKTTTILLSEASINLPSKFLSLWTDPCSSQTSSETFLLCSGWWLTRNHCSQCLNMCLWNAQHHTWDISITTAPPQGSGTIFLRPKVRGGPKHPLSRHARIPALMNSQWRWLPTEGHACRMSAFTGTRSIHCNGSIAAPCIFPLALLEYRLLYSCKVIHIHCTNNNSR